MLWESNMWQMRFCMLNFRWEIYLEGHTDGNRKMNVSRLIVPSAKYPPSPLRSHKVFASHPLIIFPLHPQNHHHTLKTCPATLLLQLLLPPRNYHLRNAHRQKTSYISLITKTILSLHYLFVIMCRWRSYVKQIIWRVIIYYWQGELWWFLEIGIKKEWVWVLDP